MRWLPADCLAWRTLVFVAGFELGLGGVAWGVGSVAGIDVLQSAQLSARGVVIGTLATVPLLLMLVCMLRWPMGPLARLVDKTRHMALMFLAPCGIVGLAIVALAAGVGEEMLTRGLIHTFALEHLSSIVALLVTGLVFGLMHPISRSYVLVAGLIGVYLGWVWRISGPDLVAPAIVHALYDFVALVVLCRGTAVRQNSL
ncbi:MAG: CPBP family intramembrane glutamic endopeptidase [Verrucomicrobiales bacterium]